MFEAARRTLTEAGFRIDEDAYRFGRLTTRPQSAPTLFEPFYGDNARLGDAVESTVNHQRRIARVFLDPSPEGLADGVGGAGAQVVDVETGVVRDMMPVVPESQRGGEGVGAAAYELRVEVLIERWQNPRAQVAGGSHGRAILTSLSRTPRELEDRGVVDSYWQPVRRDALMERRLLGAIVSRSLELDEPASNEGALDEPATAGESDAALDASAASVAEAIEGDAGP